MSAPLALAGVAPLPAVRWRDGITYGATGLPLAFVALPLYVLLPSHYAGTLGVPLAALGALLLAARLVDAIADPWIGRFADRLFARGGSGAAWRAVALAALVLAAAFHALLFPPVDARAALLAWCGALLVVVYLAYSVVGVVHQSWGARLGGDAVQRTRIVAWREGFALAGVLIASVLPALAGLEATTLVFALLLAVAVVLLAWAPVPGGAGSAHLALAGTDAAPAGRADDAAAVSATPVRPFATRDFRRLLAVFVASGIAGAVPATLLPFFVADRLDAAAWQPVFLGAYFAAAALAVPGWLALVARIGLARAWLAGMLLAVASFAWAATLGAGDAVAFAAVCIASGVALGADLVLPGALLAGVIQRAGHGGRAEGAYFGWWNFAAKANLALAAGLALPLLQFAGYAPGAADAAAGRALVVAYCVLPCLLKLVAACLLHRLLIRTESE